MAAWGYGLLGPVEVRMDGRALPLPGARQRLLLAVLFQRKCFTAFVR